MMYKDIENGKLRDLTPEEVCAMYHFHNEYAKQTVGAIEFYKHLAPGSKNFIDRMVLDILKQRPTKRAAGSKSKAGARKSPRN